MRHLVVYRNAAVAQNVLTTATIATGNDDSGKPPAIPSGAKAFLRNGFVNSANAQYAQIDGMGGTIEGDGIKIVGQTLTGDNPILRRILHDPKKNTDAPTFKVFQDGTAEDVAAGLEWDHPSVVVGSIPDFTNGRIITRRFTSAGAGSTADAMNAIKASGANNIDWGDLDSQKSYGVLEGFVYGSGIEAARILGPAEWQGLRPLMPYGSDVGQFGRMQPLDRPGSDALIFPGDRPIGLETLDGAGSLSPTVYFMTLEH